MGYAFPDPALFVSVQKEDKMIIYLKNWLRYRPIFIYRVSSAASSACPLSSQAWRTFLLSAGYVELQDSPSAFQKRRAEIMEIIGGLEDVSINPDASAPVTFCDVVIRLSSPLNTIDVQAILWEL